MPKIVNHGFVPAIRDGEYSFLNGIDSGFFKDAKPVVMGLGHALRVLAAAGDKTGDIFASGRKPDATVTNVQAPPDHMRCMRV